MRASPPRCGVFSPAGCSIWVGIPAKPGTMLRIALDYGDDDEPETFSMTFSVTGDRRTGRKPRLPPPSTPLRMTC